MNNSNFQKSIELIFTDDGSPTFYLPEIGDSFHSKFGAKQESQYVFVESGFNFSSKQNFEEINILEIGFGTGLNTFLTFLQNKTNKQKVFYNSVEKYPIPNEKLAELIRNSKFNDDEKLLYGEIISAKWNEVVDLDENFNLLKSHSDINDFVTNQKYNLVYFDAFAPKIDSEMWSLEVFSIIDKHLIEGGAIVTYAINSTLKSIYAELGYQIYKLPGAKGKREMSRAIKQ